ncbi:MAG: hypothetical protein SFU56_19470 [Capsulimonadales bacterium]|nr:hypothetical protein [Capsulimonadales bacterium]
MERQSTETLVSLRNSAGLSQKAFHEALTQVWDNAPTNQSAVSHVELKGTDKLSYLKATAAVLGKPLEVVMEANENTKKLGKVLRRVRKSPDVVAGL